MTTATELLKQIRNLQTQATEAYEAGQWEEEIAYLTELQHVATDGITKFLETQEIYENRRCQCGHQSASHGGHVFGHEVTQGEGLCEICDCVRFDSER